MLGLQGYLTAGVLTTDGPSPTRTSPSSKQTSTSEPNDPEVTSPLQLRHVIHGSPPQRPHRHPILPGRHPSNERWLHRSFQADQFARRGGLRGLSTPMRISGSWKVFGSLALCHRLRRLLFFRQQQISTTVARARALAFGCKMARAWD